MTDENTAINEWKQQRAADGRLYFFNQRTGETSWHKPDALKVWEEKQRSKGYQIKDVINNYKEKQVVETNPNKAATPIAKEQVFGTPWVIVWTDDGKHFYFNPMTKQSNWSRPADLEENPRVEELLANPPHLQELAENELQTEETDIQEGDDISQEVDDSEYSDEPPPEEYDSDNPPPDENAELIEKLQELPLEERVEIFHELLSEHSFNKFSLYDDEIEKFKDDVRFKIMTDIENKRAFDDYMDKFIINGNRATQLQTSVRKKSPKEIFFELLDDQNGKIHGKSSFRDVQLRCGKDRRWDKVPKSSDKIKFFREWTIEKKSGGRLDEIKEGFIGCFGLGMTLFETRN